MRFVLVIRVSHMRLLIYEVYFLLQVLQADGGNYTACVNAAMVNIIPLK
jgi:hypothetical protein